jgi:hypothetical protein
MWNDDLKLRLIKVIAAHLEPAPALSCKLRLKPTSAVWHSICLKPAGLQLGITVAVAAAAAAVEPMLLENCCKHAAT